MFLEGLENLPDTELASLMVKEVLMRLLRAIASMAFIKSTNIMSINNGHQVLNGLLSLATLMIGIESNTIAKE